MRTKDQVLTLALAEAIARNERGLLYPTGTDFDQLDWSKGDPETIYSIASFYADDVYNDGTWEDAIIELLENEYPDLV